ncbi:hypothetical protein B0H12DRAFT_787618 [Mycena haematopus]|nr:hypothetical protein B0H12DRAFT_787618 [Mycena haematopus]
MSLTVYDASHSQLEVPCILYSPPLPSAFYRIISRTLPHPFARISPHPHLYPIQSRFFPGLDIFKNFVFFLGRSILFYCTVHDSVV